MLTPRISIGVFCIAGWLLIHRVLLDRGFLLTRSFISTDVLVGSFITITTTAWTVTTLLGDAESYLLDSYEVRRALEYSIISTVLVLCAIRNQANAVAGLSCLLVWTYTQIELEDIPAQESLAERLLSSPLILQAICIAWIFGVLPLSISPGEQQSASFRNAFDWSSCLQPGWWLAIRITLVSLIVPAAIVCIARGAVVLAVSNVISLAFFLIQGAPDNPYIEAKNHYAADMLRIALPTSHHEGTLYILPSRNRGFDAVWSPRIAAENVETDRYMMGLFAKMRSSQYDISEPLASLRFLLPAFHRRAELNDQDLVKLAQWLYLDEDADPAMREIDCVEAGAFHLIGRDLMFAICHIEYLVFMGQDKLPLHLQAQLGRLRQIGRTGAGVLEEGTSHTVGSSPGFAGYEEAVRYVYALFDREVDARALDFSQSVPPKYSKALGGSVSDIEEYIHKLWDLSWQHAESTFTALWIFTLIWFMEMGNVNGFHIFPLRCRTRQVDFVGRSVVWRQAWYSSILAELVAWSPAFYAFYVAGVLR